MLRSSERVDISELNPVYREISFSFPVRNRGPRRFHLRKIVSLSKNSKIANLAEEKIGLSPRSHAIFSLLIYRTPVSASLSRRGFSLYVVSSYTCFDRRGRATFFLVLLLQYRRIQAVPFCSACNLNIVKFVGKNTRAADIFA